MEVAGEGQDKRTEGCGEREGHKEPADLHNIRLKAKGHEGYLIGSRKTLAEDVYGFCENFGQKLLGLEAFPSNESV